MTRAQSQAGALEEAAQALSRGQFVEAEALCRAALARSPRHAQLRALLGASLRRQRRLDEAEAELRGVVERWPRSSSAHLDLGEILLDQRRFVEAAESFAADRARSQIGRAHV